MGSGRRQYSHKSVALHQVADSGRNDGRRLSQRPYGGPFWAHDKPGPVWIEEQAWAVKNHDEAFQVDLQR